MCIRDRIYIICKKLAEGGAAAIIYNGLLCDLNLRVMHLKLCYRAG